MEHFHHKNDYDDSDFTFSDSETFDNILFHDGPVKLVSNSQHSQQVGYPVDLHNGFNHHHQLSEEKPVGILEECTSAAIQKLQDNFGVLYSDPTRRRQIDMINQCRYIASKKGMDKRQLIESIKKDEVAGKSYLTVCQSTPSWCYAKEIPPDFLPVTTSESCSCVNIHDDDRCWKTDTTCPLSNCKVITNPDGIIMSHPLHHHDIQHQPHSPQFKEKHQVTVEECENLVMPDQQQFIYVSRPPTRRGTSGPSSSQASDGESLMDEMKLGVFEDSDESDFDPSQTSDFFDKINSRNINRCIDRSENENGMSSTALNVLPPIRKPATHNFTMFCKEEKLIHEKVNEDPARYRNTNLMPAAACEKRDDDLSSNDDDYEDTKEMIIKTARTKACASYIQLRQKLAEEKKSKANLANVAQVPLICDFEELAAVEF